MGNQRQRGLKEEKFLEEFKTMAQRLRKDEQLELLIPPNGDWNSIQMSVRNREPAHILQVGYRADVGLAQARSAVEPAVFRLMSLLLPRRLWVEDLGDALEELAVLEVIGAPRWQRWLKVGSTCFWLLVNTVRELTSVVHGARQKGGDQ